MFISAEKGGKLDVIKLPLRLNWKNAFSKNTNFLGLSLISVRTYLMCLERSILGFDKNPKRVFQSV